MDSEFSKCLSSSLFTFVVGQERKEITVHSRSLANLSSPLNNLMNGKMQEANRRQADWSGVEEMTFVLLCEYAYTRDYTPPSCSKREIPQPPAETEDNIGAKEAEQASDQASNAATDAATEQETAAVSDAPAEPETPTEPEIVDELKAEATPEAEQSSTHFSGHTLPYREKSIWTQHLQDKFKTLSVQYTNSHNCALSARKDVFAPKGNSHPWEDFTPVFLAHAKLYILADKYCILPLADLVLYKLETTLAQFNLCEENISDVTELIRFSYQWTRPNDALRLLITTYVVSVLGQIGENTEFQELLMDGGFFVLDLWQMMWC
ncbi:uncharacterized protein BO80DRAFT_486638 [Aspergillus ibericus CBS 121593]|uniref:BTB domain-containing protein n=1 Tax=Aspergillus ibericus CBS 121593 TaxID=1448316 RepID=A0A395H9S2_9EURO|nr:hypothetical protein BO80DRAFT_486638 [Aspergillus ibericus CBS 121593]RAL04243.1 hypothetical protein BO80DRAFT_486638 [Aspergillus ibericus CBS 121593]